jgi:hypothetical protein
MICPFSDVRLCEVAFDPPGVHKCNTLLIVGWADFAISDGIVDRALLKPSNRPIEVGIKLAENLDSRTRFGGMRV